MQILYDKHFEFFGTDLMYDCTGNVLIERFFHRFVDGATLKKKNLQIYWTIVYVCDGKVKMAFIQQALSPFIARKFIKRRDDDLSLGVGEVPQTIPYYPAPVPCYRRDHSPSSTALPQTNAYTPSEPHQMSSNLPRDVQPLSRSPPHRKVKDSEGNVSSMKVLSMQSSNETNKQKNISKDTYVNGCRVSSAASKPPISQGPRNPRLHNQPPQDHTRGRSSSTNSHERSRLSKIDGNFVICHSSGNNCTNFTNTHRNGNPTNTSREPNILLRALSLTPRLRRKSKAPKCNPKSLKHSTNREITLPRNKRVSSEENSENLPTVSNETGRNRTSGRGERCSGQCRVVEVCIGGAGLAPRRHRRQDGAVRVSAANLGAWDCFPHAAAGECSGVRVCGCAGVRVCGVGCQ